MHFKQMIVHNVCSCFFFCSSFVRANCEGYDRQIVARSHMHREHTKRTSSAEQVSVIMLNLNIAFQWQMMREIMQAAAWIQRRCQRRCVPLYVVVMRFIHVAAYMHDLLIHDVNTILVRQ